MLEVRIHCSAKQHQLIMHDPSPVPVNLFFFYLHIIAGCDLLPIVCVLSRNIEPLSIASFLQII